MGAPKLLLPAPEGTLLRRMALLLRESVPGQVAVVLGHEALLHRRALEGVRRVRLAHSRNWALGLSQSLKAGLRALPEGPVLVLPADQGGVGPGELEALLRAFREPGVLSGHGGVAMSPALLGKEARREVWRIQGDQGAKGLLLALGARVVELGPGPWSLDVDTWEAYAHLVRALGWTLPHPPLPWRGPPTRPSSGAPPSSAWGPPSSSMAAPGPTPAPSWRSGTPSASSPGGRPPSSGEVPEAAEKGQKLLPRPRRKEGVQVGQGCPHPTGQGGVPREARQGVEPVDPAHPPPQGP